MTSLTDTVVLWKEAMKRSSKFSDLFPIVMNPIISGPEDSRRFQAFTAGQLIPDDIKLIVTGHSSRFWLYATEFRTPGWMDSTSSFDFGISSSHRLPPSGGIRMAHYVAVEQRRISA